MTIERSVPSVYARLGVRPVIHASGTTTRYGGSRMRPETIDAMREAAQTLVNIDELNEAPAPPLRGCSGPRPRW